VGTHKLEDAENKRGQGQQRDEKEYDAMRAAHSLGVG
jgi:hypothetical protein